MFCINCGSEVPKEAKFCPNCGKEVTKEDTSFDIVSQTANWINFEEENNTISEKKDINVNTCREIPSPQIESFQVEGLVEVGSTINIHWKTYNTKSIQLEIENNRVCKKIEIHTPSPYRYTVETLDKEITFYLWCHNEEKVTSEKLTVPRAPLREEIIKPNIDTYKMILFKGFLIALSYYLIICIFYFLLTVLIYITSGKEIKTSWILLCFIVCIAGSFLNVMTFYKWHKRYSFYFQGKNNTKALECYDIMLKMTVYPPIGWAGIILSIIFLLYTLIS